MADLEPEVVPPQVTKATSLLGALPQWLKRIEVALQNLPITKTQHLEITAILKAASRGSIDEGLKSRLSAVQDQLAEIPIESCLQHQPRSVSDEEASDPPSESEGT